MSRFTFKRILGTLALGSLAVGTAGAGWLWWRIGQNLPQLDGTQGLTGPSAEVRVERDDLGVPRITAASELDAYRALGFCHAQDRFFQMDSLRRRASGELAELAGKAALALDKDIVRHDFRRLAQENFARLPAGQRAIAEAYAAGVNAALDAMGAPPWEYAILRSEPRRWAPEDCALIGFTLTLELQDQGAHERSLLTLRDTLGEAAVAFLAPELTPDDSAADSSVGNPAPLPPASVINLRKRTRQQSSDIQLITQTEPWAGSWAPGAGSNAFAVGGLATRSGAAMVANDMHLSLRVPNTWYRVEMSWPAPDGGERIRFMGVTVPGGPLPVSGSNGHVAWGFTASYADTADLVPVEHDSEAEILYRTPAGDARIEKRTTTVKVRGGDPVQVTHEWTKWGPVVGRDARGRRLALLWVAHQPGAIDLGFTAITSARNADQAIAVARSAGLPALNMVIAEAEGRVAWTIAGKLPERVGYSGRMPVSHAYGDRDWKGFLPASSTPAEILSPSSHFSSANERLWSGRKLAVLGDGGYEQAYRAAQLRAGVSEAARSGKLTPADMLALQLADEAQALTRWRDLLADTLRKAPAGGPGERARLLALVKDWNGRADADAVGHRLVREFRSQVTHKLFDPILAPCEQAWPGFSWHRLKIEQAVWRLLKEKPMHLLAPEYANHESLLLEAADAVPEALGSSWDTKTWGEANTSSIRHPLLRGMPAWLSAWADMPSHPQAGDNDMPRVARPAFGASERFAVSPGHEKEGTFHMPGGQSENPRSPYFRAGHQAWAQGTPQPFLPGLTKHTLLLQPPTR